MTEKKEKKKREKDSSLPARYSSYSPFQTIHSENNLDKTAGWT